MTKLTLVALTLLLAGSCYGFSLDLNRLHPHNLFASHSYASGLGVKSKFGHLFTGQLFGGGGGSKRCETVYDDVCEEKCRTVYRDKCETVTATECSVVTTVECHDKMERECSIVFEDRCTTLQVPYCNVKLEENCAFEPQCRVITENRCTMVPKKICKHVQDNEIREHFYPEPANEILVPVCNETGKAEVSTPCDNQRYKRTTGHVLNHLINTVETKEAILEGKKALLHALKGSHHHVEIPTVHVAPVEVRTICQDTTEERCEEAPREVCEDVRKCHQTPKKVCGFSPQKRCIKFPARKCADVPRQVCADVPKKTCRKVPKESCLPCPEKVCEKVYVKRPREVCYPNTQGTNNAW